MVALMVAEELDHAGFEVVGPAASGKEALALARATPCQCALVDIDLSDGRTGPDTAHSLMVEMDVTAIFMTGQRDLAHAAAGSAVGVLTKPVDPDALVETVKAVAALRRGETPQWPRGFEPLSGRQSGHAPASGGGQG